MTDNEIKKIGKNEYQRGYRAGRLRTEREMEDELRRFKRMNDAIRRSEMAFLDRAFLAALPFAMTQNTWKSGDEPIRTIQDRVNLAWDVALDALRQRKAL